MRELSVKHANAIITAITAFKAVIITGNDLSGKANRQVEDFNYKDHEDAKESRLDVTQFATDVAQDVFEIAHIQRRLQTLLIRAAKRAESENMRIAYAQLIEANKQVSTADKLLITNETALRDLENE